MSREAELRRLVALWAPRLGLSHFRIDVRIEKSNLADDEAAMAYTHAHYERATIRFQPWTVGLEDPPPGTLQGYDGDELEVLVVHELLHVRLAELDPFADALEDQVHRDVWAVASELWSSAVERTVDRFAAALVDAWPK